MTSDNFHNKLNVAGHVHIKLYDQDGKLIDERSVKNKVTDWGVSFMAHLWAGSPVPGTVVPRYVAIGSGTTAPAGGDTALGNQLAIVDMGSKPLVALSNGNVDTGNGTLVTQLSWQVTIPAGTGTGSISEAGIFTASSGGSLFARTSWTNTLNKANGSSLSISWTITLT